MLSKIIIRSALITATILLIPLVAMQFTNEANWTIGDFIVMGVLLFSVGLGFQLIARQGNLIYKAAVGLAFGAILFLAWVNLAVGIIGSGPNIANLMYMGVFATGFLGAILARLRPEGLMRTMFAMAAAQMLVPVITYFVDKPLVTEPPGIIGVFALNAFFAILFVGSALLFRNAVTTGSTPKQQPE